MDKEKLKNKRVSSKFINFLNYINTYSLNSSYILKKNRLVSQNLLMQKYFS